MFRQEESQMHDAMQKVMDRAYEECESDMSYSDFIASIPEFERNVVVLGNLNNQVTNGGFDQWHYNGYSKFSGRVMKALAEVGGPNCRKVLELVEEAMRVIEDRDEDWDGEESALDRLDTEFYKVNEGMLQEIEHWVKKSQDLHRFISPSGVL